MIKEKINMELRARILLIISISSLILYLSVEGLNILPSIVQPNSKLDEVNLLEKDKGSRVLDEPKKASRPLFTPAPSPVQSTPLDEPKQVLSPISVEPEAAPQTSSPVSDQDKEAPSPTSLWDGISASSLLDEAESIFHHVSSPVPVPVPSRSSWGEEEAETPVTFPNPPSYSPGPGPAPFGFIDHDVALAIEARIKQSQSDAQLAMDEAKKLLSDPNIASSETGKCLTKCVDKYGASLNELNRAITDLGVRDVTLLADDFGAVENDISTCQGCFNENIGEDSPLKALEEATTKAARECLTVMDYAA